MEINDTILAQEAQNPEEENNIHENCYNYKEVKTALENAHKSLGCTCHLSPGFLCYPCHIKKRIEKVLGL